MVTAVVFECLLKFVQPSLISARPRCPFTWALLQGVLQLMIHRLRPCFAGSDAMRGCVHVCSVLVVSTCLNKLEMRTVKTPDSEKPAEHSDVPSAVKMYHF